MHIIAQWSHCCFSQYVIRVLETIWEKFESYHVLLYCRNVKLVSLYRNVKLKSLREIFSRGDSQYSIWQRLAKRRVIRLKIVL